MKRAPRGNSGRPWRRVRDEVYAEEDYCARCGRFVDQTLPANHNFARSVGHIVPPALGGTDDRDNLRLEHRICNSLGRHTITIAGMPPDDHPRPAPQPPPRSPRSQIW